VIREKEKCGHRQQSVEQLDIYISATGHNVEIGN
jgi:hypothetical protein